MNITKQLKNKLHKLDFVLVLQRFLAGLFCFGLFGIIAILNFGNPYENNFLVNSFYILIWIMLFVILEFGFIFYRQKFQKFQLTSRILQLSCGINIIVSFLVILLFLLNQIGLLEIASFGLIGIFVIIYGYFIRSFV